MLKLCLSKKPTKFLYDRNNSDHIYLQFLSKKMVVSFSHQKIVSPFFVIVEFISCFYSVICVNNMLKEFEVYFKCSSTDEQIFSFCVVSSSTKRVVIKCRLFLDLPDPKTKPLDVRSVQLLYFIDFYLHHICIEVYIVVYVSLSTMEVFSCSSH